MYQSPGEAVNTYPGWRYNYRLHQEKAHLCGVGGEKMKTDYSNLIGKEITYITSGGVKVPCKVAGAHYHFGVTLKSIKYDHEVYCSNREETLSWPNASKAEWKKSFFLEIKAIRNGVVSYHDLLNNGARLTNKPFNPSKTRCRSSLCAFSSE